VNGGEESPASCRLLLRTFRNQARPGIGGPQARSPSGTGCTYGAQPACDPNLARGNNPLAIGSPEYKTPLLPVEEPLSRCGEPLQFGGPPPLVSRRADESVIPRRKGRAMPGAPGDEPSPGAQSDRCRLRYRRAPACDPTLACASLLVASGSPEVKKALSVPSKLRESFLPVRCTATPWATSMGLRLRT
jgi:hypothetical protein